jgi:hypothetical protein
MRTQAAGSVIDSLTTSIDASKLDQRAWVGVLETTATEFTETNGLIATVVFFNSGRTPARNVQTSARFMVSPVPLTGPPANEIAQLRFRAAPSIAPQGRYNQIIGQVWTGEILIPGAVQGRQDLISRFRDIKDRTATLYYFGILRYDDIFGNHRETQFCVFLADPDTKQMGICDAFNDVN